MKRTTEQKRKDLIGNVQGHTKPYVYFLDHYGGFGVILSKNPIKESELRKEALDHREGHKRLKVMNALEYPFHTGWSGWTEDELKVLTFEERLAMANEVKEGLEPMGAPLPEWAEQTLSGSESILK